MHRLIWERLEELLRGAPTVGHSEIEDHLAGCADCRRQVEEFREQALLLRVLRAPELLGPAPGFYARVARRIEARRNASVWNALSDPGFGWRLAFGSLAALLVLGGFLAMSEAGPELPASVQPVSVIAAEEHPPDLGMDPQKDRDTVLVTLATYRE